MSEPKVLHRVAGSPEGRGWSVSQVRDGGPYCALYDEIGYQVDRYTIVVELARLATRVRELEAAVRMLFAVAEEMSDRLPGSREWMDDPIVRSVVEKGGG